ncbi:unnamed protein product [Effrenium voratum]|nr:unnamed protein product [Effrenium voratum]
MHVNSSERLNPNLYRDGKVCLSLLGTWAGPGWDPEKSTLLQVLVSLQGLVLVEDPYFNEPGHQWDANTEHGRNASALYNENVRLLALRAALNTFQQPPKGFEEAGRSDGSEPLGPSVLGPLGVLLSCPMVQLPIKFPIYPLQEAGVPIPTNCGCGKCGFQLRHW